uniref:Uncharacterized protein n=1 Tax=Anguilla anguilla TaxID=7936 RepID=A0A0E9QEF9_ANGAN
MVSEKEGGGLFTSSLLQHFFFSHS